MKQVVLVDDLDGSTKEVDTIHFGLDGQHFEIDLSQGNANELRTALAAYQAVARPSRPYTVKSKDRAPTSSKQSGSKAPVKAKSKPSNGVPSPSAVREWAKSRGIDVNAKGRIPKSLIADYLADK